jgi:hypothetical protein
METTSVSESFFSKLLNNICIRVDSSVHTSFVQMCSCAAPTNKQTNSVALSPRANYTDWSTSTYRRKLVSTFVDRGVSRGQRGGSPTVVNLSFLDRAAPTPFANP